MSYTPRRANLRRWLQDAPSYVLDCFDDKGESDRYTVFFGKEFMCGDSYANASISYIGVDANGYSMSGELDAHQCVMYRYRNGKQRVQWNDLPLAVHKAVIHWATYEPEQSAA